MENVKPAAYGELSGRETTSVYVMGIATSHTSPLQDAVGDCWYAVHGCWEHEFTGARCDAEPVIGPHATAIPRTTSRRTINWTPCRARRPAAPSRRPARRGTR